MRANKTSTPRVSAETSTQKEKADTAKPRVASNAPENGGQGVFLLLTMLSRTVPLAFAVDPTERKRLENAVTGLVQAVDPQDGLEIMAATQWLRSILLRSTHWRERRTAPLIRERGI